MVFYWGVVGQGAESSRGRMLIRREDHGAPVLIAFTQVQASVIKQLANAEHQIFPALYKVVPVSSFAMPRGAKGHFFPSPHLPRFKGLPKPVPIPALDLVPVGEDFDLGDHFFPVSFNTPSGTSRGTHIQGVVEFGHEKEEPVQQLQIMLCQVVDGVYVGAVVLRGGVVQGVEHHDGVARREATLDHGVGVCRLVALKADHLQFHGHGEVGDVLDPLGRADFVLDQPREVVPTAHAALDRFEEGVPLLLCVDGRSAVTQRVDVQRTSLSTLAIGFGPTPLFTCRILCSLGVLRLHGSRILHGRFHGELRNRHPIYLGCGSL